jgi:hypothetical protein
MDSDHERAAISERRCVLDMQPIDECAVRGACQRPADPNQSPSLNDTRDWESVAWRESAVERVIGMRGEERKLIVAAGFRDEARD